MHPAVRRETVLLNICFPVQVEEWCCNKKLFFVSLLSIFVLYLHHTLEMYICRLYGWLSWQLSTTWTMSWFAILKPSSEVCADGCVFLGTRFWPVSAREKKVVCIWPCALRVHYVCCQEQVCTSWMCTVETLQGYTAAKEGKNIQQNHSSVSIML